MSYVRIAICNMLVIIGFFLHNLTVIEQGNLFDICTLIMVRLLALSEIKNVKNKHAYHL